MVYSNNALKYFLNCFVLFVKCVSVITLSHEWVMYYRDTSTGQVIEIEFVTITTGEPMLSQFTTRTMNPGLKILVFSPMFKN